MNINSPSLLSDIDLVAEVKRLVRCEREATVQLVAHLAELDARRLYLGAGFPSLFTYCCEVLQLSEQQTYNRIEAARAARRFPIILNILGDASVNLTTVRLLAPHLTPENHEELLRAARRKSKREVEELLARRFPRPPVADSVRKLPAPKTALELLPTVPDRAEPSTPSADGFADAGAIVPPRPVPPATPAQPITLAPNRRPVVTPLAADRYEIRFTASASTCEKLRLAHDLLRHAVPTRGHGGDRRSRAHGAARGSCPEEVRGDRPATGKREYGRRVSPHPQGQAGGLAQGRRSLRFRG